MRIKNLPRQFPNIKSDEMLVNAWLHDRPDGTRKHYAREARKFLAAVGKPLAKISSQDLSGYAASLSGADATISTKVSTIKSLLSFAFGIGFLKTNIGAGVVVSPGKRKPQKGLSRQDIKRLLSAKLPRREQLLTAFLYFSGARPSSTSRLSLGDVGQAEVTLIGKSHKRRTVPIPSALCEELRALAPASGADAPIFMSLRGNRLGPRSLRRILANIGCDILERHVNPRMLRHAHATHALAAGAPVHHLQRCLGHESLATTGVYVDASPGANSAKYLLPPWGSLFSGRAAT